MSPAFSSRRRADQFDALLRGTLDEAPAPELAALASLAGEIRALPEIAPRPAFAASLRERLMAEAAVALAEPPAEDAAADNLTRKLTVGHADTSTRARRERRIAIAIAAFSVVGAATGTAAASQGSLPGDTLYPVKRLIEDAHTSLSFGDGAKGSTLLGQAGDRLAEVERLRDRADADPADLERALDDYASQSTKASDLLLGDYAKSGDQATITRLHEFTQQGITTLASLVGTLPASTDDALASATQTLIDIDQAVSQACPGCDLGGILELPSSLMTLVGDTVESTVSALTPVQPTQQAQPVAPDPAADTGQQQTEADSTGSTSAQTDSTTTGDSGGKTTTKPSTSPTSLGEGVGGVVGGVGDGVGGVVGGVGDTLGQVGQGVSGPLGETVGGLGDTVDDVGDGVDDTVGSVGDTLGGLLGSTTTP
ncbi:DUF5667 domain-containing protein [Nocardioides sp.]|uniref:DUF5667 domain-containing protein n=1 Tax=Nocardioides sp. TaxID=35761 RepID=UPI0039E623E5